MDGGPTSGGTGLQPHPTGTVSAVFPSRPTTAHHGDTLASLAGTDLRVFLGHLSAPARAPLMKYF